MVKYFVHTCLLLLACSLGAGAQQLYMQVEVRQPAQIRLSAAATRVLVVNNAVEQPANFGHRIVKNGDVYGTAEIDLGDAARNMVFAMTRTFEELERFDEVSVLPESQNTTANFYSRHRLTQQQADSLCEQYGADALIALNQLVIYDALGTFMTDEETYYAYLEAYCSAQWTVHYKGRANPFPFNVSDTLVWENEALSEAGALGELPDRTAALLDVATYEGEQTAAKLAPEWVTEDRYLYQNKDEQLVSAFDFVRRRDWESAARIWKTVYEEASRQKASRRNYENMAYAAADLAVALEMQDDYTEAIAWAEKSMAAFRKIATPEATQQFVNMQFYLSRLKTRKAYVF